MFHITVGVLSLYHRMRLGYQIPPAFHTNFSSVFCTYTSAGIKRSQCDSAGDIVELHHECEIVVWLHCVAEAMGHQSEYLANLECCAQVSPPKKIDSMSARGSYVARCIQWSQLSFVFGCLNNCHTLPAFLCCCPCMAAIVSHHMRAGFDFFGFG